MTNIAYKIEKIDMLSIESIAKDVCKVLRLEPENVYPMKNREEENADARAIISNIANSLGHNQSYIGSLLGINRTTVISAYKRADDIPYINEKLNICYEYISMQPSYKLEALQANGYQNPTIC